MASGGRRPNAGRKKKAPELKALAGTARKDRETAVGEPAPAGAMVAPMHLGDLELLYFNRLGEILLQQGRSSPHYAEHVALVAIRLAQVERFKAVLDIEGDTFVSESAKKVEGDVFVTRMVRARPEVAMLGEALRHAQSLLGELMLNPVAALKIADGHKGAEDPFDGF